jgi:hypothetical protein
VILIAAIAAAASGKNNKSGNASPNNANNPPASAPTPTTPTSSSTPKPTKPKPSLTGPQQQAVQSAQNYLSMGQGFSRAGLIQQLSSQYGDGFPEAIAVFAVNYLKPNWGEQAVLAAKGYKATGMGFSCSGMIQQLSSSAGSGFTRAQAVYGATKAGVC